MTQYEDSPDGIYRQGRLDDETTPPCDIPGLKMAIVAGIDPETGDNETRVLVLRSGAPILLLTLDQCEQLSAVLAWMTGKFRTELANILGGIVGPVEIPDALPEDFQ